MYGNDSESDKIWATAAALSLVCEVALPFRESNPGEQLAVGWV